MRDRDWPRLKDRVMSMCSVSAVNRARDNVELRISGIKKLAIVKDGE
jgi:hypothetical protein